MASAIRKEGGRVGGESEYRNKLWRVTTYIEADGRVCEGDRASRCGPMKMEQCSETSVYKIQTPGNHPKESVQHSGLGENFEIKKSVTFHNGCSKIPPSISVHFATSMRILCCVRMS